MLNPPLPVLTIVQKSKPYKNHRVLWWAVRKALLVMFPRMDCGLYRVIILFLFIRYDLAKYASSLADVKHSLDERVHLWRDYETTYERIASWLDDSENSLKNFTYKNTLQEKVEQLERFQVR